MKKKITFLTFLFVVFCPIFAYARATTGAMPFDAGYSFAGYVTAERVFAFLGGAKLFVAVCFVGLFWAIYQSVVVYSGNLKPVVTYFITISLIWAVFGGKKTISDPDSYAESLGKKPKTSTADFLKGYGVESRASVPAGLFWISNFEDALVFRVAKGISDLTSTSGNGYFENPFSYIWARDLASKIVIDDPKLEREFRDFCLGPFQHAIMEYEGRKGAGYNKEETPYWPGAFAGTEYYTSPKNDFNGVNADIAWGNISNKLYKYSMAQFPHQMAEVNPTRFGIRVRPNETQKDAMVRTVCLNQMETDPVKYSSVMITGTAGPAGLNIPMKRQISQSIGKTISLPFVGAFIGFLSGALQNVVMALPTFQGLALFLAYAFFPFILLLALIPNRAKILFMYFLSLFWIKSWTIGWALTNSFSQVGWSLSSKVATHLIPFSTLLFALSVPAITYMLLVQGSMSAVSALTGVAGGVAGGAAGQAIGAGKTVAGKV